LNRKDVQLTTHYSSLNNRVVFITGGATGIGAAMVKAFVAQHCKVAFVDINTNAAQQLMQEFPTEKQQNLLFYSVDVTVSEKLQQAIHQTANHWGSLDVLVNNVANDMRHKPEDITAHDWHQCMQVNLDPAFFASQAAYQHMKQQQSGSIINFSSINAIIGPKQMTGYVTAKAGLMGMTKALANDFGADNIRVNAILPGWVATEKQLSTWLTEEEERKWLERMALKKRLLPDDVAKLALFLAADDSSMITGQGINIDGGRT
jgi:NAD(P)-dependent dehydrogenase (short-subunit alcohol dehydrogenase family)